MCTQPLGKPKRSTVESCVQTTAGAKKCTPRHFQVPLKFFENQICLKKFRILQQSIKKLTIEGSEIAFGMI